MRVKKRYNLSDIQSVLSKHANSTLKPEQPHSAEATHEVNDAGQHMCGYRTILQATLGFLNKQEEDLMAIIDRSSEFWQEIAWAKDTERRRANVEQN